MSADPLEAMGAADELDNLLEDMPFDGQGIADPCDGFQFIAAEIGKTQVMAVSDSMIMDTDGVTKKASDVTGLTVSVDQALLEATLNAGSGRYIKVDNDGVELKQTGVGGVTTSLDLVDRQLKMMIGTKSVLQVAQDKVQFSQSADFAMNVLSGVDNPKNDYDAVNKKYLMNVVNTANDRDIVIIQNSQALKLPAKKPDGTYPEVCVKYDTVVNQVGAMIQLDASTGVITLAPAIYIFKFSFNVFLKSNRFKSWIKLRKNSTGEQLVRPAFLKYQESKLGCVPQELSFLIDISSATDPQEFLLYLGGFEAVHYMEAHGILTISRVSEADLSKI